MDNMSMAPAASATTAAMASSTAMSADAMDMGGNGCKISMLWNWYTIDACFLSSTWQVKSSGAFAGSCIGVIALVMVLEALRRCAKEYDVFLIRKRQGSQAPQASPSISSAGAKDQTVVQQTLIHSQSTSFRPSVIEQAIRALLHMLQFAVAYFIMLLAMYYNGYIIICIFIGAYIGSFLFNWTTMGLDNEASEATYCCG